MQELTLPNRFHTAENHGLTMELDFFEEENIFQ